MLRTSIKGIATSVWADVVIRPYEERGQENGSFDAPSASLRVAQDDKLLQSSPFDFFPVAGLFRGGVFMHFFLESQVLTALQIG